MGQANRSADRRTARPWRLDSVWAAVAAELRGHLQRGLGRVLTEDVVRFATARALVAAGVDVAELGVEAPHPVLKGSRIGLVVGREQPRALIEVKFPREPNEIDAAWTMALGEVLRDFYRLAAYPGEVDRVFVYVETTRLRRHLAGAARRCGVDLDTDTVTLHPTAVAGLPASALAIIGTDQARHRVTASRLTVKPVSDTLRLALYQVDPLTNPRPESRSRAHRPLLLSKPVRHAYAPSGSRNGARREILDAIRAVLTRSGASTFTLTEVIAEMTRRGTGYAETTIRTMVTSHMCRNAPNHAGTTYSDLERVDRGVYRLVAD